MRGRPHGGRRRRAVGHREVRQRRDVELPEEGWSDGEEEEEEEGGE